MRIGELARRSGVTVRTVRYYIEEGLLPAPPRKGKYGEFDEAYIQRLSLIRQLKKERLSLPDIRQRLIEFGLVAASPTREESEAGLFRSRFAQEAGLTIEQIARLEEVGLLESSEGLLASENLPLARAVSGLLAVGATMEDAGAITEQTRREAALHKRLLGRSEERDPLSRALQWQEQVGAVDAIRRILLRRWAHPVQEEDQ